MPSKEDDGNASMSPGEPSGAPVAGVPDEVIGRIFGPGTGAWYEQIVEETLKGMDRAWKERMLERIRSATRALDLACGTGLLTAMLRERFPDCHVVAVDMNAEYLELARERAEQRGDERVEFVLGRAEDAPFSGAFDLILTCYLPKYADLPRLVPRLLGHLEPGGMIIMQDFCWPTDRFVADFLTGRFEELAARARQNMPEAVGMFEALPDVIRESKWLEELGRLFREGGLEGVDFEHHDLEQAATVWGFKPR